MHRRRQMDGRQHHVLARTVPRHTTCSTRNQLRGWALRPEAPVQLLRPVRSQVQSHRLRGVRYDAGIVWFRGSQWVPCIRVCLDTRSILSNLGRYEVCCLATPNYKPGVVNCCLLAINRPPTKRHEAACVAEVASDRISCVGPMNRG